VLTGNRGEWAEIYTLLSILAKGTLSPVASGADEFGAQSFPIQSVMRPIAGGKFIRFERLSNSIKVFEVQSNQLLCEYSTLDISILENRLLQLLQDKKIKGTFSDAELQAFLDQCGLHSINAPSGATADLFVQALDLRVGGSNKLGFSIKSQLGSPSTLANANAHTTIRGAITGDLNPKVLMQLEELGDQKSLRQILETLQENSMGFELRTFKSETFTRNLRLVDSSMPELLLLLLSAYFKTDARTVVGCVGMVHEKGSEIRKLDDTEFLLSHGLLENSFIEHKMKDLLVAFSSGLRPGTPWNGLSRETTGTLVVDKVGHLGYFHAQQNWNSYRDYLYRATRFETPDRRLDFGVVKREKVAESEKGQDSWYIDFNFQIRFIE
jgi:type II restriction enzyme